MNKADRLYFLHALSPLHVGAGRGDGYIDLPLMREKGTNYPLVPGSSIKGVFADRFKADDEGRKSNRDLALAFGLQDSGETVIESGGSNAGALVFTDARLLCLAVRSFYGTFAWCTSPLVLHRFERDLEFTGVKFKSSCPTVGNNEVAITDKGSSVLANDGHVFLEDLDLKVNDAAKGRVNGWADELGQYLFKGSKKWQELFQERFCLVPNQVFDFLCETGTEVQAHIRIDEETKIVKDGALWYEESLPTESILVGHVWCDNFGELRNEENRYKLLDKFCGVNSEQYLQIGGKATVGKGRVRCQFVEGGK